MTLFVLGRVYKKNPTSNDILNFFFFEATAQVAECDPLALNRIHEGEGKEEPQEAEAPNA